MTWGQTTSREQGDGEEKPEDGRQEQPERAMWHMDVKQNCVRCAVGEQDDAQRGAFHVRVRRSRGAYAISTNRGSHASWNRKQRCPPAVRGRPPLPELVSV